MNTAHRDGIRRAEYDVHAHMEQLIETSDCGVDSHKEKEKIFACRGLPCDEAATIRHQKRAVRWAWLFLARLSLSRSCDAQGCLVEYIELAPISWGKTKPTWIKVWSKCGTRICVYVYVLCGKFCEKRYADVIRRHANTDL